MTGEGETSGGSDARGSRRRLIDGGRSEGP